jgi:hypothetical protein
LFLGQSLADRAKGRIDLLKNTAATQLQVAELEQELKQVREAATAEKKKLEDELAEEKRMTQEANAQFNAVSIGVSQAPDRRVGIAAETKSCRCEVKMWRR